MTAPGADGMKHPVVNVLARVQKVNLRIGGLLVELLNHDDPASQAAPLRELGQYLASLSAECLARAAQADGHYAEPPTRVAIDARDRTLGRYE